MTVLFDNTLELSSTQLLADQRVGAWSEHKVEIWLFADLQTRQALSADLDKQGIKAEVFSAYKPLLHFFLENQSLQDLFRVEIRYPVHAAADSKRFLLEAYPLARMLQDKVLVWIAHPVQECPHYEVTCIDTRGNATHHTILAPNQIFSDHLDRSTLCPTGLLRVTHSETGDLIHSEYFQTEIQQAYRQVMQWVQTHPWGQDEPYFERMVIRIDLPGSELFDVQGTLLSSTYEALHEDLYFSILEFFQSYSGRPQGDRGLQPGQIVPDIRVGSERVRIQISLFPVGEAPPSLIATSEKESNFNSDLATIVNVSDLQAVNRPLCATSVDRVLSTIKGNAFEVTSRQARIIQGVVHAGLKPAIVLTGGQHANEPSGVIGALRGGHWLASVPEAHFALVPIENPDGYQLYEEYCSLHPQHMHHAARYTGLGDDLEYREHAPWYERSARMHAVAATGAQLHLSLHGYPAHEWTRPFTGYVPRGFELWSIPKGFFLIVRYQSAFKMLAHEWLGKITSQIALIRGLSEFNAEQLKVYAAHAGDVPFEIHHGIACLLMQNDSQPTGIKLVTEFPDESVLGEAFQFAQQVQTETVRIACETWWQLHQAT